MTDSFGAAGCYSRLMETKRLMRSSRDKWLGGVAGGLAHYFNIDSTLVRLGFLLTLFAGGAGVLIYIFLWIVMPISYEY